MLASGLALLAIYAAARIESFVSSRAAIREFDALSSQSSSLPSSSSSASEGSQPKLDSPAVDFSQWSKQRIQVYRKSVVSYSGAPLAILEIPKIHLEVPVLDGTDDLTLNRAVGRIAGTAWPPGQGNIGIAGHRDGFFRGLKNLKVGDTIELRTLSGARTYVVDRIQIVDPHDVQVLQTGSVPSLTLVTCYPFYFIGSAPQRYIVSASLPQKQNPDQASHVGPSVTNTIPKGE